MGIKPIGENLLDKASRNKLPPLLANDNKNLAESQAVVKFFTPDSNWTWYASEFDGKDEFFGLVVGFCAELGYFSLSELQKIKGPWGMAIERDLRFKPTSLQELINQHKN